MTSGQKSWIRLLRVWCVLIAVAALIQGGAVFYIASQTWEYYLREMPFVALMILPPITLIFSVATIFKPKLFWFIALISTLWLGIQLYIDVTHPTPLTEQSILGGTMLRRLLNLFIIWMTIRLGRKATSPKWDDDVKSIF